MSVKRIAVFLTVLLIVDAGRVNYLNHQNEEDNKDVQEKDKAQSTSTKKYQKEESTTDTYESKTTEAVTSDSETKPTEETKNEEEITTTGTTETKTTKGKSEKDTGKSEKDTGKSGSANGIKEEEHDTDCQGLNKEGEHGKDKEEDQYKKEKDSEKKVKGKKDEKEKEDDEEEKDEKEKESDDKDKEEKNNDKNKKDDKKKDNEKKHKKNEDEDKGEKEEDKDENEDKEKKGEDKDEKEGEDEDKEKKGEDKDEEEDEDEEGDDEGEEETHLPVQKIPSKCSLKAKQATDIFKLWCSYYEQKKVEDLVKLFTPDGYILILSDVFRMSEPKEVDKFIATTEVLKETFSVAKCGDIIEKFVGYGCQCNHQTAVSIGFMVTKNFDPAIRGTFTTNVIEGPDGKPMILNQSIQISDDQ